MPPLAILIIMEDPPSIRRPQRQGWYMEPSVETKGGGGLEDMETPFATV